MPMAGSGGRRRGGRSEINYWPGFVDALSTLLLAIVFLISIFMVGQFFLSREVSGQSTALDRLNRQISELTDLLALERSGRRSAQDSLNTLQTTLQGSEADRARLQGLIESGASNQAKAGELNSALEAERLATGRAMNQVEILNQQIAAMRRQLAALEDALAASESRDNESQARIADLGSRLNVALAQRVQELARYRSDFFGRLRQILGTRSDVRIVGDRFVFQSEVLFPAGQANLRPEAGGELDRIASALVELERRDSAGHPVGRAGRRTYGRSPDRDAAIPLELGPVGGPRHRGRPGAGSAGHRSAASRRRGLRRIPASRPRNDGRGLFPQPPHRAQAHGALSWTGVTTFTRPPGPGRRRR